MLTALTAANGDDVLTVADAKVHLNIASSDTTEDAAITAARNAAIDWAEGYSGKALDSRQFVLTLDKFSSVLSLPIGPVTAVASVKYYDSDGTDTTIASGDYLLSDDKLAADVDATWPVANGRPGGVRVTFTAGYANAAAIPAYLLAAVKLALTAFFEDRSNPDLKGAMLAADQFRSVL